MEEVRYYNSPITLEEAEQYIQSGLITAARAYVANGYYLRRIRDDKLFEESGYQNFEDYVRGKYNKDKGWASKCIKVNQQLSEGGDSPILSKHYLEYSTYQLVELAYMTEEQREEADPDMTVNQLKQIRKPEEAVEPEISCDVTTSEQEEEQDPEPVEVEATSEELEKKRKEEWLIRCDVLKEMCDSLCDMHSYGLEKDRYSMTAIQRISSGNYGFGFGDDDFGHSKYSADFKNSRYYVEELCGDRNWEFESGEIDQHIWNFNGREWHNAHPEEQSQERSTFNSEPTPCLYREGYSCTLSEEKKMVPGDGHSCGLTCCWSCKFHGMCKMECNASAGRDGEFPEYDSAWFVRKWAEKAPGGLTRALMVCRENSINAERAKAVQKELSPYGSYSHSCGEKYDFSFHSFAGGIDFRIGKVDIHLKYGRFVQELMNLYPDFVEPVSKESETVIKEPENVPELAKNVPDSPENIIDGEFVEVLPESETPEYTPQFFLQEQSEKLNKYLQMFKEKEPGPSDIKFLECQKTIVAALACMVAELERPEPESEPVKPEQPELPILKNNDQRAAFVDAYETWPLWIETKETEERYYRYDLPTGSSMVVKVYHTRIFDYKAPGSYEDKFRDGWGDEEYYLLREGKFFRNCRTSRPDLIEMLKELQKKK